MIGVLVSGEGTNLQALLDAGLPVVAVASNVAGARALERAAAADVPDVRSSRSKSLGTGTSATPRWPTGSRGAASGLWSAPGTCICCAASFLDRFPSRVINVHPAPLPDFPGARPLEDVLAAGASNAAATVHFVDEGADTGSVIASEPVPVEPGDTVETLRERVHAAEHRLLPAVVRDLLREA